MPKIRVLAISPALDVTFEIGSLRVGETNRAGQTSLAAGGKGVNVARTLALAGADFQLLAPLGGKTGDLIESLLASEGIALHRVDVIVETRVSVALVEKSATLINQAASAIDEAAYQELVDALKSPGQVTVISGSVPSGLSDRFQEMLLIARSSSEILIVDTSGESLLDAASVGADFLKPNLSELMQATGEADLAQAGAKLLELGAGAVLCSLGEEGAQLIRPGKTLAAVGPTVSGNPTGAGDAMVAAVAIALAAGADDEELLRKAIAAGALAVAERTAGVVDWQQLGKLEVEVMVREVMS